MNRRDFLRNSSTAAAFGVAAGTLASPARAHAGPVRLAQPSPRQARNVIFMVADGMSMGTLTLADLFRRHRDGRTSNWVSLWNRQGVRRASATTYSADAWVTDSAAGGSAWGCGAHVNNGVINISPEGRQLVPILVHAKQNDKKTGLVTTTRVTHATPASFIANASKRDMWRIIAPQILERDVDVVLGGGKAHFSDELLAKHTAVSVVRDREQLLAAKPDGRLMGLFAKDHVPMVFERTLSTPSLVDMTNAALARLNTGTNGFVLQIEGGRVDHAAHNNDAGSLIAEQLDFDDTIGAVLQFLEGRDDTLLVVTTDHANANPGLTLYGKPGKDAFDRLSNIKHSFDWVWEEVEKLPSDARPAAVAEIAEAATGIGLDKSARELLARSVMKKRVAPFATANGWTSVLGALLADHLGVAFTGPNHTSDMVEVTALGPGSEAMKPAIDNIDLHQVMVSSLNLKPATLLPGMDVLIEPAKGVNDD